MGSAIAKIIRQIRAAGALRLVAAAFAMLAVGCGGNMKGLPGDFNQGPILQGTSSGNPGSGFVSFKVVFDTVLKDSCVSCHGADKAVEGIRYDTYEATIQHGDLRNLHASYLQYHEPSEKCKKISVEKMDLVRTWIEQGANQ